MGDCISTGDREGGEEEQHLETLHPTARPRGWSLLSGSLDPCELRPTYEVALRHTEHEE